MPRPKKGSKEAKEWAKKMREAQLKKHKKAETPTETEEPTKEELGLEQQQEQPAEPQPIGECSDCSFPLMEKSSSCPNCGASFEDGD